MPGTAGVAVVARCSPGPMATSPSWKSSRENRGGPGPLGHALLAAASEWVRQGDRETRAPVLEAARAAVRQRDGKPPLHLALRQSDAFRGRAPVDGRAFLASFLDVDAGTGRTRQLPRVRLGKRDEAAGHQDGHAARRGGLPGDGARPTDARKVAAVDKRGRC